MDSFDRFVLGMSLEKSKLFDRNPIADIRKYKIIGKATTIISKSLRQKYPDFPKLKEICQNSKKEQLRYEILY